MLKGAFLFGAVGVVLGLVLAGRMEDNNDRKAKRDKVSLEMQLVKAQAVYSYHKRFCLGEDKEKRAHEEGRR